MFDLLAYFTVFLSQGHTVVLIGIKTEIGKPKPTVPDEGYLEFFVDWYVKLSPHFGKKDYLEQRKRVPAIFHPFREKKHIKFSVI